MNYLTFTVTNKKVWVSTHAKQRAIQRARLFLSEYQKSNIEYFLVKDFYNSVLDSKYINCPFYHNRYTSYHGNNSFTTTSQLFEYFCVIQADNSIVIKSLLFIGVH